MNCTSKVRPKPMDEMECLPERVPDAKVRPHTPGRKWLPVAGIAVLAGAVFLFAGCPLKFWTGFSCPACGMTRAMWELLQGHVAPAFYYHPLFWLPLPVAVTLFSRGMAKRPRLRTALVVGMALLLLAVYAGRLLGRHPVAVHETPGVVRLARHLWAQGPLW